ncbi:MAG: SGNH/GDSL hydrolase family protein [Deltaproteobacteria bacterium]|nr:SGNH/GDSL hydrolase family protein [Deltaproteobacteria bacterium]
MKRFGLNLLFILFGFTFAAILAELLLRAAGIGYGNSPVESHAVLHHIHPPGYKFTAYDPGGEYGGHEVRYDNLGIRRNGEADVSADYKVAFMGDSFVEALSVPAEKSFVGLLQAQAGEKAEMLNFGVSSYSPVLYLLQWREVVKKLSPKAVVVMLYSNDILTAVPSKYRLSNNEETFDKPQFSDRVREWATGEGVNFIDLTEAFNAAAAEASELFFERDIHFNEDGHKVTAQAIWEQVNYASFF